MNMKFKIIEKITVPASLLFILTCLFIINEVQAAKKAQVGFSGSTVLSVDFNRDGIIDFNTSRHYDSAGVRTDMVSQTSPFVFWINDDDDDKNSETSGYDVAANGAILGFGHKPDYENSFIDGSRDLIDFFPVGVSLNAFINNIQDAENFTYIIKQADSAVNIVYTEMFFNNADEYLKELNINKISDTFGLWQNATKLDQISSYQVTSNGIEFPQEFINLMKLNANKGVLLVEINAVTVAPLILEIKDLSNNVVLSVELYLKSANVRNMYQNISLRDSLRDELSTKWGGDNIPDISGIATNLSEQEKKLVSPDTLDKNRQFIFIHGFNVNEVGAAEFGNETFKRFFQSGSNMLFTAITWNGNAAFLNIDLIGALNYWGNVENAFYTADDLAVVVNGLFSGNKKIIAGHSLGNMVIGSAMQDFGMNVDNYFMINPAVALEAYDATRLEQERMMHTDWSAFYDATDPNNSSISDSSRRHLWSIEWHTLFPNDERKNLTWRNRFGNVITHPGVVQYYSNGEEVLARDDIGIPVFLEGADGRNAWSVQEKAKGTDLIAGVLVPGVTSGGWGFGTSYQSPICDPVFDDCETNEIMNPVTAFSITQDKLKENPFFKPFLNKDLTDAIAGGNEALKNFPYILAFEIPALSFAAGSTELDVFGFKRFDMNANTTGWPFVERKINNGKASWFHSDFKDVSYLYTHKVFDDMVRQGKMR